MYLFRADGGGSTVVSFLPSLVMQQKIAGRLPVAAFCTPFLGAKEKGARGGGGGGVASPGVLCEVPRGN